MGSSASRRIATYRRAARSVTPSRSPRRCAVMPGLFWMASRASRARAVGLTPYVMFPAVGYPGSIPSGTGGTVPVMRTDSDAILREPPPAGSEADTLLGSLERQRRTFAWKCGNLDAAGLRATLGPATMTLGGL